MVLMTIKRTLWELRFVEKMECGPLVCVKIIVYIQQLFTNFTFQRFGDYLRFTKQTKKIMWENIQLSNKLIRQSIFAGQMLRVEGDLDLFTEVTQGHKWTQKWKNELSKELTDFVDTCFTQVTTELQRQNLVLRHT